jgi:hypothetical protein
LVGEASGEEVRKVFFFEKKKQKTFAHTVLDLARKQKSKSFLALFFKK